MNVLPRFLDLPDQSCFLFGPRGTGKSTWLKQCLPDALYIDLLAADNFRELNAKPERLIERTEASPSADTVVVDEIQRVPELLPVIHTLIETDRNLRFVMTGSSARKLRRGGFDLLGGRAVVRTMHPFMAAELPSFSLDDALTRGLIPLVMMRKNPLDVLSSYVNVYLDEEVRSESLTRNLGAFIRFLEAVSFSQASVLSLSSVARECQVKVHVVRSYISILDDLLLSFSLPVFRKRAKRAFSTHPKFFWFDVGVFRTLRPRGPLDRPEELGGAALEGLVAQHIRAWCDYTDSDAQLYFWRTRAGSEVDFIVYGENAFVAIEVKHSSRVDSHDLRALRTFASDYPEATCFLLYRGTERLKIGEVWCIPVEEFLLNLRPERSVADIIHR